MIRIKKKGCAIAAWRAPVGKEDRAVAARSRFAIGLITEAVGERPTTPRNSAARREAAPPRAA